MAWHSPQDQDPWQKPQAKPNNSGEAKPNASEQEPTQDPRPNGNANKPKEEQGPPDLEEAFKNLLGKLNARQGKKNASGNGDDDEEDNNPIVPPVPKGALKWGVLGALLVWGVSGFYTVSEGERGVVSRLGKLHRVVQPGLNWKPTFIDRVDFVNVDRVLELKTNGSMLTQDENMVKVEMTVQYRISEPANFLFNVDNAENSLKQATDSALRYVIGHMTMDDVLTTGRAKVREKTWKTINEIIAQYKTGLQITDVNFQSARPPEEVKAAFDDAIKAQEDEQRAINEANAYAREKEPIARGQAKRIVEQANAYKEKVVLDAQGEVARLSQLLPQYKAAPALTRERLYIQTMEKIMANTPKVISDNGSGKVTVLPLESLLRGGVSAKTAEKRAESTAAAPTSNSTETASSSEKNGNDTLRSGERRGRFE